MQDIEPFYNWRELYIASEDELSPFHGTVYSEFEFTNTVYNYYIHPQWDEFGSATLYLKVIFADYERGYAVIEFIGEWNDAINNDIMILKRDVADDMIRNGINKFILIGENVMNFHGSDDEYYAEWFEEIEDGWIAAINFREHILEEWKKYGLDYYINFGGTLEVLNWRTMRPQVFCQTVEGLIQKRLD